MSKTPATYLAVERRRDPEALGRQPVRHVHVPRQGGSLPVEGTAHPGEPGRVDVRMLLHNEGNADKAVTSAAAIFDIVG
jgi:hypothetical protein